MKIQVKDAQVILELMIKKGQSQRQFAKEIDVSSPYFSQILNGNRNPGPAIAKKICDALDAKFDDIFFINNGYKSEQKSKSA
ncbi:helix-turn-helix transcriptional regulator [Paenibacillus rhizophilus]|uniref:XRE family transcriptional regulator n=1 Tax=Paenibacillus rhizophilus TaxID=1850366 RepID=A0A3N9P5M2_9BACL|nr:helix-turn-helix transcriptional regulator [Paenibacillus rhizophilus]RQW10384.1 XRE family transcriptional regulator [Paenibacillus rhizophilus]